MKSDDKKSKHKSGDKQSSSGRGRSSGRSSSGHGRSSGRSSSGHHKSGSSKSGDKSSSSKSKSGRDKSKKASHGHSRSSHHKSKSGHGKSGRDKSKTDRHRHDDHSASGSDNDIIMSPTKDKNKSKKSGKKKNRKSGEGKKDQNKSNKSRKASPNRGKRDIEDPNTEDENESSDQETESDINMKSGSAHSKSKSKLKSKNKNKDKEQELQPQFEQVENPMGHDITVGSRATLKWGDSEIWSPTKCLPYAVNNRALTNETNLVKVGRGVFKQKGKYGLDSSGKKNLFVQTNAIKTPLDSNMRKPMGNKSKFNRNETLTLQQISQIKNTKECFKVMIKNLKVLGNMGVTYDSLKNSHNVHEMEARMGNDAIKLMDAVMDKREKEDNTINNIDRAVNPQAAQKLMTRHGVPVLPACATTLSFLLL